MDPKLKRLLDQVGGELLPPEFANEVPAEETIVNVGVSILQIYKIPSQQWAGVMIVNGSEVGRIAECQTEREVEDTAREQGFIPDLIEKHDE
jgi:hypothetical protein